MTTIATDGRSMAGDGLLLTCGIVSRRDHVKVFRFPDGRLFGGCGKMGDLMAVRDWLASSNDWRDRPTVADDFGAVLVDLEGVVSSCGNDLRFTVNDTPFAIGSGMEIAMGAMDAGASPEQAVRIAAGRDTRTGGTITMVALS